MIFLLNSFRFGERPPSLQIQYQSLVENLRLGAAFGAPLEKISEI